MLSAFEGFDASFLLGPTRDALIGEGIAAAADVLTTEDAIRDPLRRLFDPAFTATTWEYDHSHIGPTIPGKLHAKQLEMLHAPAKHRWLFWGNQVGKTTKGAVDVVLSCLGRHPLQRSGVLPPPPWTAWASALTWELWEKILLPELLTWIPRDRILDAPPPHRKSLKRDILIRADNGRVSRITGKAAEQGEDKYQSARVNQVWMDEEHPEPIYDEILPRLLRYGGRTLATMTPLKGLTWVHDRIYLPWKQGAPEAAAHFCSHAGLADNPSIAPAEIASITVELRNNPSQLAARLHGHFVRPTGAVLPWDPEKHFKAWAWEDAVHRRLVERAEWHVGLDLGKWRFAMPVHALDDEGQWHLVEEYFSQNEDEATRAKGIHDTLTTWKVPPDRCRISADCAEPDTIAQLNEELDKLGSPYLIGAVDFRHKIIKPGVLKLENLLNRGAFRVRRGIGTGRTWYLGRNSGKPGKPVEGSRWVWEITNWQYPKTEDGKVQKDEPDDATADGADMMDGSRYAVMRSYEPDKPVAPPRAPTLQERLKAEIDALDDPEPNPSFGRQLRQ